MNPTIDTGTERTLGETMQVSLGESITLTARK